MPLFFLHGLRIALRQGANDDVTSDENIRPCVGNSVGIQAIFLVVPRWDPDVCLDPVGEMITIMKINKTCSLVLLGESRGLSMDHLHSMAPRLGSTIIILVEM
jgi:hypothetical protein